MNAQSYRTRVESAVSEEEYEQITDESTGQFDPVWHKQTEDPTIGLTQDFVTVLDTDGIDQESIEASADEFRALLSDIAPSEPGTMENLFGYVVFAVSEPGEDLIEFATEEYTVADRRTSVFPLVFGLETETLHRHPVPRLKGRGFYEKQKLDAESLFSL